MKKNGKKIRENRNKKTKKVLHVGPVREEPEWLEE